ncbi:MAG TPA: DUF2892 domain-containing protein [Prolixibacteraceae bacterium]|nr:DUF2892 domain-containing protein [Prolixibacteraceae bacterium]
MGTVDRVVRVLIALTLGILYFTHAISGLTATILIVVAVVLLLTSLVSFCPLWALLGIKTVKK